MPNNSNNNNNNKNAFNNNDNCNPMDLSVIIKSNFIRGDTSDWRTAANKIMEEKELSMRMVDGNNKSELENFLERKLAEQYKTMQNVSSSYSHHCHKDGDDDTTDLAKSLKATYHDENRNIQVE